MASSPYLTPELKQYIKDNKVFSGFNEANTAIFLKR